MIVYVVSVLGEGDIIETEVFKEQDVARMWAEREIEEYASKYKNATIEKSTNRYKMVFEDLCIIIYITVGEL